MLHATPLLESMSLRAYQVRGLRKAVLRISMDPETVFRPLLTPLAPTLFPPSSLGGNQTRSLSTARFRLQRSLGLNEVSGAVLVHLRAGGSGWQMRCEQEMLAHLVFLLGYT